MEKIKVIIVDDNVQSIKRVKEIIGKREDVLIVGEAKNGKSEIDLINSLNPDIVITDNKMPILNGIDVIESFKDKVNKPFFIMISSDMEMMIKSVEYNYRYLDKLSNFSKLNDFIDEYINSKNEKIVEIKKQSNKKQSLFSRLFRI